jgi:hypothetical protein
MHYVIVGEHSAEVCPSSNAATRALLVELGPQIPAIAEKNNVNIVAGPFINREHSTYVILESATPESVDAFLMEARLPQWNKVRVIPSLHIAEAMQELQDQPALF